MSETKKTRALYRRRSLRIPMVVPLLLTSRDPETKFSESCVTSSVSKHGCLVNLSQPFDTGFPVRLDIQHTDRSTTAKVVYSRPTKNDPNVYDVALELDKEENFWGLRFPPREWTEPSPETSQAVVAAADSLARAGVSGFEVPGSVEDFEKSLRDVAIRVSAEFEGSYRQTLGDLLARLRADHEEQLFSDLTRYQEQMQQRLSQLESDLQRQTDSERRRLQEQANQMQTSIDSLGSLRGELQQKLQSLSQTMEEQVAAGREALLEEFRQRLRTTTEGLAEELASSSQPPASSGPEVESALSAIHEARDYIESLVRMVPQTVEARLGEALAEKIGAVREQLLAEVTTHGDSQLQHQFEQLRHRSEKLTDEIRDKLLADFDQEERQLLDRVYVRLNEVKVLESGLRQYVSQIRAELESKSEQLAADLARQLGEQAKVRSEEFDQHLRQLSHSLTQRTRVDMAAQSEKVRLEFRGHLQTDSGQSQKALEEALAAARQESKRIERFLKILAGHADTEIQQRLDQALREAEEKAAEEFRRLVVSLEEEHFAPAQDRMEGEITSLLNRGETVGRELQDAVESAESARADLEPRLQELQQEAQQAAELVASKESDLRKFAHDFLLEVSGEIRGRIHQAVDMVQEPLERHLQEGRAQLEQLTERRVAELSRRLEENRRQFLALEEHSRQSAQRSLQTLQTEALTSFRRNAQTLLADSTSQLQQRVTEALQTVFRALSKKTPEKEKRSAPYTPDPDRPTDPEQ